MMKGGTLYAELRAALDRGHHLQHVQRFEVPICWKKTHGENIDKTWADNKYTAHLPRGRSYV